MTERDLVIPFAVAVLSEDRAAFTLSVGTGINGWSRTYDVRELAGQLRFYRGLRDRRGGAFARFYQNTVKALERVEADLRAGPSGSPSHGAAAATGGSAAKKE